MNYKKLFLQALHSPETLTQEERDFILSHKMTNEQVGEKIEEMQPLPTSGMPEAGGMKDEKAEAIAQVIYTNIIEYGRQAMPPDWKEYSKTIEGNALIRSISNPTPTPQQVWNKAIEVADNVCHNRVNIFAGQTQIVNAIELCRKEIMQYFNDEYHIKKLLGTEPPEDKWPSKIG